MNNIQEKKQAKFKSYLLYSQAGRIYVLQVMRSVRFCVGA